MKVIEEYEMFLPRFESNDKNKIAKYFNEIESLVDHINFINFVVGGETITIELSKKRFKRGITFETPRESLINAIENEIFDDLLIGNFTKTILNELSCIPTSIIYKKLYRLDVDGL